ncbi:DUF1415 domain-containing protein [Paucibacter sp. DJ1R-11]|uniref:DUF1415 domain-containing protein n=1 Tax=Paucibacter sp. DJ1R-11 TaxID=2893556 RepID=UPI0021E44E3A|nr:DUF1415 domain-containing protein [Paucibacter sp. DJ1R-11]MCV2365680.1 DUF1415 domain-containing protein [Paucibacter sp. DJ1R-11]
MSDHATPSPASDPTLSDAEIDAARQETQHWLEKAVIGLNLCPFAKSVHVNNRLRYVVSQAATPEDLLKELARELLALNRADPDEIETTVLIHPRVLTDFLDFNDFLGAADALVEDLELDGLLQVASFHPDYQFAGTDIDDISNYSNRSPYPTLHLLRESSIERATETMADTDAIYEANMATLEKLGLEGWKALGLKARS